jgi:hypothetical protein
MRQRSGEGGIRTHGRLCVSRLADEPQYNRSGPPLHANPLPFGHLQRAPGGIRTLTPLRTRTPEARASSSSAAGASEWPTRLELALRPWQGRVLPLTLRPHGASGEIRTHDLRLTEAALCPLELQRRSSGNMTRTFVRRFQDWPGCQQPHPGMEPSPGADPGLLPYRGRVTAVCDGKAPAQAMAVASASRSTGSPCLRRCWMSSVRFERTLPAPHAGAGASCRWATRTWSRHPVPTRAIRRTKAKPQPCAAV